jgi:hypothetical protein
MLHFNMDDVLKYFPSYVKLSYEHIMHKKVDTADILFAIPRGKKCLAWFVEYNNSSVCFILDICQQQNPICKKDIVKMVVVSGCFSRHLSYGTILYGTLFEHMHNSFFSVEDIPFYKGRCLSSENWKYKIDKIIHLLQREIQQIAYNRNQIVFGMPIMAKTNDDMNDILILEVKYPIECIEYRNLHSSNTTFTLQYSKFTNTIPPAPKLDAMPLPSTFTNKNTVTNVVKNIVTNSGVVKEIIFEVKADIQNDIYFLHTKDHLYYGTATIPYYKTSMMMNALFRNIKENVNLDKLEESDDEEEFECSDIDKYVDLNRQINIKCRFHKKFKKWYPISVSTNQVSTLSDVQRAIASFTKSTKYVF